MIVETLKSEAIKKLGRFISIFLTTVIVLYIGIIVLLNIPFVQHKVTAIATRELSKTLNTEVHIGDLKMGMLDRVLIEDFWVNDQSGRRLLEASRLSARLDPLPLLRGKVTIHAIQLFGLHAKLEKENPEAVPNYQFVIDALSSQDTLSTSTALNLRINAVLVRNGDLQYSVLSEPQTEGVFNPSHLHINNLRANISLKALTNDSINTTIRQLSFNEQCGFNLKQLSLKLTANRQSFTLSRFQLELPESLIKLDSITGYHPLYSTSEADTLLFRGGISDSYLTPRDLACFLPSLSTFEDRLHISTHITGGINDITLSELNIMSDNKDVRLSLNGQIHNLSDDATPFLDKVSSQIQVSSTGVHFLFKNLTGDDDHIPPELTRLGNVKINLEANGPIDHPSTHLQLQSVPGRIESHLVLDSPNRRAKGMVETEDFQLGKLLGKKEWGNITFNLEINGKIGADNYPEGGIKGLVSSVEYKQYTYHDVTLDGFTSRGGYDGLVTLNDPNGELYVYGSFNAAQEIPEFNLTATLKNFKPHNLHLSDKYEDTDIALNITANFSGNTLDNIKGSIDVDSLLMIAPNDYYFLENLNISSQKTDEQRRIAINSDFMKGSIEGEINFATLPTSISRLLNPYAPSLFAYKKSRRTPDNNFSFDITFTDTDLFYKLFNVPITLRSASTLKGYLTDEGKKMKVEGYFPDFSYDGMNYESGMILCENPTDEIKCLLRATKRQKDRSMVNFSVLASAKEDQLKTTVTWGNNTEVTYSGKVSALVDFQKENEKDKYLRTLVHIEPSHIIMNDTIWNLHQSEIKIDSGHVFVDRFEFEHDDQYLRINGSLTDKLSDSLIVNLNKIKLEYVFDVLQFHPVDFKGMASGRAFLNNVFNEPVMEARLFVQDFKFNDGLMGDMHITGQWDKEQGIYLDADIREPDISHTTVQGFVSPISNGLDLTIRADSSNIHFLNTYVNGIFDEVEGRATGNIHLYGPFSQLNIEGEAVADATFYVEVLNAHYTLRQDSIKFLPNQFLFEDVSVYDPKGHRGILNGTVNHQHFDNMSYTIHVDMDNALIYNGQETADLSFYGTVYGTGEATLNGNYETLNVDINMRTEDNTLFVYNAATPDEITSSEFITFVDHTPKRETDPEKYGYRVIPKEEEEEEIPMDIRLNIQVDVTSEATIRVIMDPIAGDYITTRGSGTLRGNYYNKGDFKLYGTYTLDYGLYKLSLQEVIRKEFQFRQGGTVTFSGDPYDGILDLQAVYTVNSASLNDLVAGASFTQSTVRVNCLMNLTGRIFSPDIDFDLELPTVNEEEREIVRSYISTDEQMEMQIIYLLGIGRFYTYDYNSSDTDSGSSSAMNSLLSTTLSGQLNNMLSQVIDSNQWNFGTNLSTGSKGWTDMEVEGILSGRLLNNRLLINGNFGYRENALENTNFVGDFDVQWLLTPSGEISLKGYNQTNDRYFTKSTLTTQGVGIIFKKDFDRWAEIVKRKKAEESSEKEKPKAQQKREEE